MADEQGGKKPYSLREGGKREREGGTRVSRGEREGELEDDGNEEEAAQEEEREGREREGP